MYTNITLDERYRLANLLKEDFELVEISERLGRSASSIGRELDRNSKADGSYEARYAHKKARLRRQSAKVSSRKIENDNELAQRIEKRLHPLVSPEVICQEKDVDVCFETIYTWIRRSRPELNKLLPYRGKKRRRYGTKRTKKQGWTSAVRDIDERSDEVERREDLFHWEGDTVHGIIGNLLTYTERTSRFEKVALIGRRECSTVHERTKEMFSKDTVKSFTYDRGSEFALWRLIEKDIKTNVYFAKPHHPWQRGSNENMNGRIRRVYPKKTDFSTITQKDIDAMVWKMNHTKRKCLGWRTPCAVFGACCTSS